MTYRDATARLFSLEHWGIKLGLESITRFCRVLGDPQERYVSIHIAGTNGKGSTSAYMDSILRAAGYRVGRYTSPHLRDFRERIFINGQPIPRAWVTAFVKQYWRRIRKERTSFFEVTTALAFAAFARAEVDVAVVEVGLGGRFDATNIVPSSLSIITRIARDHEHVLGHTPGKIAFEKAGIIKPGVPVLTGPLFPEAAAKVRATAEQRRAPLWTATEILQDPGAQWVLPLFSERWRVPLAGTHQCANLALALAGIALLRTQGIDARHGDVRTGVKNAHWPARFQIAPGRPTVVYDAAHNPDGLRAVVETWERIFGSRRPVCVFTTRTDKNYREMVSIMSPLAAHWLGCPLPGEPGVARPEMERLARRHGLAFTWADSPRQAMQTARRLAGARGFVLVVGSHYLVGAVIPPALINDLKWGSGVVTRVSRADLLAAASTFGPPF